ncbi:hypothetical protein AB0K89_11135 [Streptomyces cinnamoneus]|uniref:hypothetical protein n=1 Tax=Streptomyces cinnamoneus TaxID=53446 RepID=UPI003438DB33
MEGRRITMTAHHTHLTPDLPPLVEVPDLPGAPHGRPAAGSETEGRGPASGNGSGAHQEVDGRHEHAGEGSGG